MQALYKSLKVKDLTSFINFYRKYSKLSDNAVNTIKSIVGTANISLTDAIRSHHSKDESFHRFVKFKLINFNNV